MGTDTEDIRDDGKVSVDEKSRRRMKSKSRGVSRRDAGVNDSGGDKKQKKKRDRDDCSDDESSLPTGDRRKKESRVRRRKLSRKESTRKRKRTKPASASYSSDNISNEDEKGVALVVVNEKLLSKLSARGETLDERKTRRAQTRAAHIQAKLGYTAEENPFNDPNLTETFTWKKRDAKRGANRPAGVATSTNTLEEIEKVRRRRKDREEQFEEMERIRAEESRMKELENFDEWAQKEEKFHLQQQRHRSAIRLVEGREKPIDVLAKNILMFGLSDDEKKSRDSVKYQERYNAMDAIESLEAELEEPPILLKMLKLNELEELMVDIAAFRKLEREASAFGSRAASFGGTETNNTVLQYWDNLHIVADDEIKYLKSGGDKGSHAKMVKDVTTIFEGQSYSDLNKMKGEIATKLRTPTSTTSPQFTEGGDGFDRNYWLFVQDQLMVHLAKSELSDLHSMMLVRQLERLEVRKDELATNPANEGDAVDGEDAAGEQNDARHMAPPQNVPPEFGDLEEELGLDGEIELQSKSYSWQDRYRPRKPRYFNRVKSGYDWNRFNQTHYDRDNPPPKVVQGYKFNIFYPDLIDPTKTPQFFLEAADTEEFCIIRFRAGPPYEDIAFKIVNREWNRSRKRGFKSTFERGVLSLYFNFTTHWYRK